MYDKIFDVIARIWKGAVRREDGDEYAQYVNDTGLSAYAETAGNRGAWMLRRDVGDRTEFLTFSLWAVSYTHLTLPTILRV